ncbi:MAG: extracellular solute-binding protein [bacterium]|nr:extracellular solute-binding protein [bacterium]
MKKNKKRILSFYLILLAALTLCACGKAAGEEGPQNPSPAKEHVFKFREVSMPKPDGDEFDVCASSCREQTVSLLIRVRDWEHYNDNDLRILSFPADGSEASLVPLKTVPWTPDTEDGEAAPENSYYENCTFGADGRIYANRNFYKASDSSGENNESRHFLCCWEKDGRLLWEAGLEDCWPEEAYVYVKTISVAEDGSLSLILSGDRTWLLPVDSQGNPSAARELSEEISELFERSITVLRQPDGSLLLVCYGEENWEEQSLTSYVPATDTVGKTVPMPSASGWDGCSVIAPDGGSGILYGSRTGIFSFSPADAESKEEMNFINSDLNVSSFDALIPISDTAFAGLFYEGYGGEAHLGVFTYTDPAQIPDRSVLVLAGVEVSDRVIQRVVEFNRNNDRYRIVIQNVEEYDSDEAVDADIAKITSDIFSGDMPDILVTDGLPAETYAARGLLTDIGEWIENDPELSRTEFLQNVFDAYSPDGKLYYVIPSFEADTMIGASSVVGDRTSWTLADAVQLLQTLPDGTNLIPETSQASFLGTALAYCGGSLTDVGTGKCSFQSQDFLAILEYAKSLPKEAGPFGEDYWRNYEAQFSEGRTVLADMTVSSFEGIAYYINGIFGEEISYIGFPSGNGSGAYLRARESYAVSARCACPEGAWEFVRYYLTDEYQSCLKTGLPVQKKYFLERAGAALTDSRAYGAENESGPPPLTEEQLKKLTDFIFSVTERYYANEDITKILDEETQAFFAGDKTAEETAKIIQSKVQLYLDENRKQ